MRNLKLSLLGLVLATVGFGLLAGTTANAQTSPAAQPAKGRAAYRGDAATAQQPLFSEYKGVRLGMTDKEVLAKLGKTAMSDNELDFFVFSEKETAQVNYDAARKVITISIDYADGVGAPDHKAVVGGDLQPRNGSLYKMVRYESLGFWVSYNRTAGPVSIVTITIQKI